MSELENLLRGQRAVGRLDSQGSFQVDFQRAFELLGRCSLPTPYHYQHKLVQAAVAAGARGVEFKNTSHGLEILVRGWLLQPDELSRVLSFALEDGAHRPLAHLARSLHAALRLGARRVELEAWDALSGHLLSWERNHVDMATDRPPRESEPGLSLLVRRGFFTDLFAAGAAGWHRGGAFLYAPIPICEMGQVSNQFLPGTGKRLSACDLPLEAPPHWDAFVVSREAHPDLLPGPGGPSPPRRALRVAQSLGDPETRDWEAGTGARLRHLTVAGQPALGCLAQLYYAWGGQRILWVHDGVVVGEDWNSLGNDLPACVAVVTTHGLRADLTGFGLVRDEAFGEAVSWLRREIQEASSRGG